MALTKWLFLYTANGLPADGDVRQVETPSSTTILAGFPSVDAAIAAAPGLMAADVQLIELCGGFGPLGTAKVLAALDRPVPIGAVAYGPESVDGVHAIFAKES